MNRGPFIIEDDAPGAASPALVPPVPDPAGDTPRGAAMQAAARVSARRGTSLGRWFWRSLSALVLFFVGVAAWTALETALDRSPLLGGVAVGLTALFLATCLGLVVREVAALLRLGRVADLQQDAARALAEADLSAARAVADRLDRLYAGREAAEWGRARLAERRGDSFDADSLLALAEQELLLPFDGAAQAEVEAAARQVAGVTAVVPLALADVAAALVSNLRMIRRIAEIYGGRAGTIGAWRLTRTVMAHLIATGAVAVGDDMIGSVAGGSVLARVSRRFGEGIINGALTARVGVAAIEVCRPLPFVAAQKPKVHKIIGRALGGLFTKDRS